MQLIDSKTILSLRLGSPTAASTFLLFGALGYLTLAPDDITSAAGFARSRIIAPERRISLVASETSLIAKDQARLLSGYTSGLVISLSRFKRQTSVVKVILGVKVRIIKVEPSSISAGKYYTYE